MKYHSEPLSDYRFLVTGGAGFIGSHLVEYLLNNGAKEVRVLDNLATGFLENINDFSGQRNFSFLNGSITNPAKCREACAGIDFVLHHAALGSVPRSIDDPVSTHLVNATGFLHMLIAARDAAVKRFIYASSSSVYGNNTDMAKKEERTGKALSPYAVTKALNEQYALVFSQVYGMVTVGLRYFNIFGPRQNPSGEYAAAIPLFIEGLLNKKPVYINGDGEQSRDFTFVSNAVQANMRAILAPAEKVNGEVFNIAAGNSISINKVFATLRDLIGSAQQPIYRAPRKGELRESLADISKAADMLGYKPEIFAEEGLKKTLGWFKR
ncbi:MAG TPA: SDR family oxidoreductase [Bacteroidia bacterium]|nr:SDR family oxidoreductase [Bacteroidia bacterium]